MHLDVKKIVKDFGGMTATARLLTQNDHAITPDGVDKWRRRQTIPTKPILRLCLIAQARKQRFDLLDYIID